MVGSGHVTPRIWEVTIKLLKGRQLSLAEILSIVCLCEWVAAMPGGDILQTPKKTYPPLACVASVSEQFGSKELQSDEWSE